MKAVLALALIGAALLVSASDASAVVCARGVYRAGCAGPRGAVVVRRPYAAPYARPYVAPRAGCAWVNGRYVCGAVR